MRKAAFDMRFVIVMIISWIALIILIYFVRLVGDSTSQITKTMECKQSLKLNAIKLKTLPLPDDTLEQKAIKKVYELFNPFGNAVKLDCSTNYIEIKSEDPEAVRKEIADEMIRCWNLYLEGRVELFDTADRDYCVVCSRMEFNNEVEVEGLIDFMMKNPVPAELLSTDEDTYCNRNKQGMTYWDCLMGVEVQENVPYLYKNSELEQYDKFVTDFPLGVIYYMGKEAYPGSIINQPNTKSAVAGAVGGSILGGTITLIGLVVSGPVGGFVGIGILSGAASVVSGFGAGVAGYLLGSDRNADWDARIVLWNYDELKNLGCTYLESKSTPLEVVQKE